MTVVPAQLDRVIADPADFLQRRARNFDKAPLGAMPLAKRARTIPTQVRLRILTHVAIVPRDAHDAARLEMVDLRRNVHTRNSLSPSSKVLFQSAIMQSSTLRLARAAAASANDVARLFSEFDQPVADRGHESNPATIDQISARSNFLSIY
jgi:hypothetical protein